MSRPLAYSNALVEVVSAARAPQPTAGRLREGENSVDVSNSQQDCITLLAYQPHRHTGRAQAVCFTYPNPSRYRPHAPHHGRG